MFRPLTLEDKAIFDKYINSDIYHSQYSFLNLFIWRHEYKPEIAVIDDCLCITLLQNNCRVALMPVGIGDIVCVMRRLLCEFHVTAFAVHNSDDLELVNRYFNVYNTGAVRSNFDYLYETQKLISLSGRKLHSKRNHLKKFFGNYQYRFEEISCENIIDCLRVEEKWIDCKKTHSYDSEYKSIKELIKNFRFLGCRGGIIYVDNLPVAFAIGEICSDSMTIIHAEKAIDGYLGLYPAINQLCAEKVFSGSVYINREEDMGIEALRKAKLSYYPDKMIEYYLVRI